MMKKLFTTVFAVCLTTCLNPASNAENSAQELLEKIQERAAKVQEFKALLNNPDQATRLAALDLMTSSEDPVMQEAAYSIGFASADNAMRAVALRRKLKNIQSLAITFDSSSMNEKEKNKYAEGIILEISDYDAENGQMNVKNKSTGKGQITGTKFNFKETNYTGQFELRDNATLEGKVNGIPATILLQ